MRSSESDQHRKLKELISDILKNLIGVSLNEYPSSGHELDVYGVDIKGTPIYIEIIWASKKQNFLRDMNLIQEADAKIKFVVANPEIIKNSEFTREFSKVSVAQRRFGIAFFGEMFDGKRILDGDKSYIDTFIENIKAMFLYIEHEENIINTVEYDLPNVENAILKKEELSSNLFLVKKYPEYIFISETFVKDKPEALLNLPSINYPFLIKRKSLITFDDITRRESPFDPIVVGEDIQKISFKEYIKNENNRRDYMNLLNVSLKLFLIGRKLRFIEDKKLFVCTMDGDKPRTYKWRNEVAYSTREIAKPLYDTETGDIFAYLHYSAKINFIFIDNNIYLKIEPSFYYTKDKENEVSDHMRTQLNVSYLSKQFNESYYDIVRFWAKYISKLSLNIRLDVGSQLLEISSLPSSVNLNRGIKDE